MTAPRPTGLSMSADSGVADTVFVPANPVLDAVERRRPGRLAIVNPALVPLLRKDARSKIRVFDIPRFAWTRPPDETDQPPARIPACALDLADEEELRAARGIMLALAISAVFWSCCFWLGTLLL